MRCNGWAFGWTNRGNMWISSQDYQEPSSPAQFAFKHIYNEYTRPFRYWSNLLRQLLFIGRCKLTIFISCNIRCLSDRKVLRSWARFPFLQQRNADVRHPALQLHRSWGFGSTFSSFSASLHGGGGKENTPFQLSHCLGKKMLIEQYAKLWSAQATYVQYSTLWGFTHVLSEIWSDKKQSSISMRTCYAFMLNGAQEMLEAGYQTSSFSIASRTK